MSSSRGAYNIKVVKNATKPINGVTSFTDNSGNFQNLVLPNTDEGGHFQEFIMPNIEYIPGTPFSKDEIEKTVQFIKAVLDDSASIGDRHTNHSGIIEILRGINYGYYLYSNKSPFRGRKHIIDKMIGPNAVVGDLLAAKKSEGKTEFIPTTLGKSIAAIYTDFLYLPYKENEYNNILGNLDTASKAAPLTSMLPNNIFSECFTGRFLGKNYLCFSSDYTSSKIPNRRSAVPSVEGTIQTVIFSPDLVTEAEFNNLQNGSKDNFNTIQNRAQKNKYVRAADKQMRALLNMPTVIAKPALASGSHTEIVLVGGTESYDVNNQLFYTIVGFHKLSAILKFANKKFSDIEFRVGSKDLNGNKLEDSSGYSHYPVILVDKKTKDIVAITQEHKLFVQGNNLFFNKSDEIAKKSKRMSLNSDKVTRALFLYNRYNMLDI